MSRRTRNPLDVPLAFTDTYGADDPGTLVVSTDDPAVTRTLRTEQASIFDALGDAECYAGCPDPTDAERVLFCTRPVGHGPDDPRHTDGEYEWTFPTPEGARTPTARPVRVMAAGDAVVDSPAGCEGCGTPTDPLERFPGGLCLTCYTPIGEAKARTMTADRLARMWGAR